MANRELEELLVKADDIRRSVALLIKEELDRKKDRQTGPAIGQKYWVNRLLTVSPYVYDADDCDIDIGKYRDLYPEERFAEAELRARKLIVSVNKRRRELNEGKQFRDRKYYIDFWNFSGLAAREESSSSNARWNSYPFGLFKDSADCKTCIREFEDELDWFYKEYLPLMQELDDYDWADAPGWGE